MTINRRPSLAEAKRDLARRMWSHRLFRRMLERQGIDPRAVASRETETMFYRGLDRCAHCSAKQACQAWLAGAEASASYVRFCPNSETIEALRITGS